MEDGIKTFPFPVKLDDKIKMVEVEFGVVGYVVVWKLHQAIYDHGYYLKWDIDTQLLFIDDYRLSKVGRNAVSEVVACCLRRGVFESSMFEKYQILTSERIQETFLMAKSRSKKVIVDENYALPIVYTFIENANKNNKNVNIFFKNACIFEQKKGKERKRNNTHKSAGACAREGKLCAGFESAFSKFCEDYDVQLDNYSSADLSVIDFTNLREEYEQSSKFLQIMPCAKSLSWICKQYQSIVAGKYRDFKQKKENQVPAPGDDLIEALRENGYSEEQLDKIRQGKF